MAHSSSSDATHASRRHVVMPPPSHPYFAIFSHRFVPAYFRRTLSRWGVNASINHLVVCNKSKFNDTLCVYFSLFSSHAIPISALHSVRTFARRHAHASRAAVIQYAAACLYVNERRRGIDENTDISYRPMHTQTLA